MGLQTLQQPWNAEDPTERERGALCRLETARFEETRVEGRYAEEGYYEFARFVAPLLSLLFKWLLRTFPNQSRLVILSAKTGD